MAYAKKPLGMRASRARQRSPRRRERWRSAPRAHAVPVQFVDPGRGQRFGLLRGQLPAQLLRARPPASGRASGAARRGEKSDARRNGRARRRPPADPREIPGDPLAHPCALRARGESACSAGATARAASGPRRCSRPASSSWSCDSCARFARAGRAAPRSPCWSCLRPPAAAPALRAARAIRAPGRRAGFQIALLDARQQPVGNLRAQVDAAARHRAQRVQQIGIGRLLENERRARRSGSRSPPSSRRRTSTGSRPCSPGVAQDLGGGFDAVQARAGRCPSAPGAGWSFLTNCTASAPFSASPTTRNSSTALQDGLDAIAHDLVIIDEEDVERHSGWKQLYSFPS